MFLDFTDSCIISPDKRTYFGFDSSTNIWLSDITISIIISWNLKKEWIYFSNSPIRIRHHQKSTIRLERNPSRVWNAPKVSYKWTKKCQKKILFQIRRWEMNGITYKREVTSSFWISTKNIMIYQSILGKATI